jgi:hypothetical protein
VIRTIHAVIVIAAVAASAAVAATPISQATPVATLRSEDALSRTGQTKRLWALFTPRFHRQCPYAKFAVLQQKQAKILKQLKLRVTGSRVVGARAYVSYRYLLGTKVAVTVTGDVFVKIRGRWFDELDHSTRC